jgi:glycosyltransferase involved in cell wall biosynthesis
MEAIASGCYCVSHWWDGANELLPDGDLYYTDRQLIDLLEAYNHMEPAQREILRERQFATVAARFNVENISARILEIVEQAAQ